jgi:hypothetical protein
MFIPETKAPAFDAKLEVPANVLVEVIPLTSLYATELAVLARVA